MSAKSKKAGVVEHPEVFDNAGLLANEPPGTAGLPFIKSSDNIQTNFVRIDLLSQAVHPVSFDCPVLSINSKGIIGIRHTKIRGSHTSGRTTSITGRVSHLRSTRASDRLRRLDCPRGGREKLTERGAVGRRRSGVNNTGRNAGGLLSVAADRTFTDVVRESTWDNRPSTPKNDLNLSDDYVEGRPGYFG